MYLRIEDYDQFSGLSDFARKKVSDALIKAVRELHEIKHLDHLNLLQTDALKKLQDAHTSGQTKGIVVLPTGSGKTRIGAIDSKMKNAKRILYVAHTHEILTNAEREFAHVYGKKAVNHGWHSRSSVDDVSVHLSTIQSISRGVDRIPPHQ